jgi:hypothetical protein
MSRFLVLDTKYGQVHKILRIVSNMVNYYKNLPAEKKDELAHAINEMYTTMTVAISTGEVVEALVRELEGSDMETVDVAMKILELLATENVVQELLNSFKNESAACATAPSKFSARWATRRWLSAPGNCGTWTMRSISPRKRLGHLTDESFYVARNAIDLVAKVARSAIWNCCDCSPTIRTRAFAPRRDRESKSTKRGDALAKMRLPTRPDRRGSGHRHCRPIRARRGLPGADRAVLQAGKAQLPIINALGRLGGRKRKNCWRAPRISVTAAKWEKSSTRTWIYDRVVARDGRIGKETCSMP